MNYATIKHFDIANGEGVRTSLFVSGCSLNCLGCWNSELQNPNYGKPFTPEVREELFATITNHIAGLSILGGDPMFPPNAEEVLMLCAEFKERFPLKTLWVWTGYILELEWSGKRYWRDSDGYMHLYRPELFEIADVVVVSPFILAERNLRRKWAGSNNQRVIDCKKTLSTGEIILYTQD